MSVVVGFQRDDRPWAFPRATVRRAGTQKGYYETSSGMSTRKRLLRVASTFSLIPCHGYRGVADLSGAEQEGVFLEFDLKLTV